MLTSRRIVEGFDNSTEMIKLLSDQASEKEQQNEITAEGRGKKGISKSKPKPVN